MKNEDIVLGTTYRLRQWDDLAKEYGASVHGYIDGPSGSDTSFIDEMKPLCGAEYTPTGFCDDADFLQPPFTEEEWCISAWMLEPISQDRTCSGEAPERRPTMDEKTLAQLAVIAAAMQTASDNMSKMRREAVLDSMAEVRRQAAALLAIVGRSHLPTFATMEKGSPCPECAEPLGYLHETMSLSSPVHLHCSGCGWDEVAGVPAVRKDQGGANNGRGMTWGT